MQKVAQRRSYKYENKRQIKELENDIRNDALLLFWHLWFKYFNTYIEKGKVSILQNGKISINFFLQKK